MGDLLSLCSYRKRREAPLERTMLIEARSPFMLVRHVQYGSVTREETVLSESMLRDLLDCQGPWMDE